MINRACLFSMFTFILFAIPASHAGWRDLTSKDFAVAPPPAAGSDADKVDLAEVYRQYLSQDDLICKWAHKHGYYTYGDTYVDFLTPAEISKTKALLDDVLTLSKKIVDPLRVEFARPRPKDVDERIKPCFQFATPTYAYPSSHAAFGTLSACVLKEVFPEKSDALFVYGNFIGDSRVATGVHYPSDITAGRKLGNDICKVLLNDQGFQKELKALKTLK